MQCTECQSSHIRKNGINRQGKQNYICVNCERQFITFIFPILIHQRLFRKEPKIRIF